MAWAHTPSPAPCFLRSLAGLRCPDADLSEGLDLVTWHLALLRAALSQGLQLRPPRWRCCSVWPRGRTTPSQGKLSRKTHRPQCALVLEIQRVPSSSPVRALTLCEHFRDRSEDHPEAACRGQHRAPDWLHRQRLPGVQGSGHLLGSGLRTDEQRCDRGLPAASRDGQRRWSATSRQCSAGKSVLSAPSGQPWVLRPPERNQAGERGQVSLAPWPPAFLTARGQLQAR